jgi:hypothetical protein
MDCLGKECLRKLNGCLQATYVAARRVQAGGLGSSKVRLHLSFKAQDAFQPPELRQHLTPSRRNQSLIFVGSLDRCIKMACSRF